MKLKEGMYVRYTRGMINRYVPPRIARIVKCLDEELMKLDNDQVIMRSDIVEEPSFNLIDLIKTEDFINGVRVIYKIKNRETEERLVITGLYQGHKAVKEIIDSDKTDSVYSEEKLLKADIVTKEQFEAMKYEVK